MHVNTKSLVGISQARGRHQSGARHQSGIIQARGISQASVWHHSGACQASGSGARHCPSLWC